MGAIGLARSKMIRRLARRFRAKRPLAESGCTKSQPILWLDAARIEIPSIPKVEQFDSFLALKHEKDAQ